MAIYHCSIKIISRAGGRSAVASAAYRSGEKLYNDETGITHDFTRKGGVVMNEIILPANAPAKYKDREILWNEVQKIEKRSDAQFAREVEVAFPVEMTRSEQIECVRDYINENFAVRVKRIRSQVDTVGVERQLGTLILDNCDDIKVNLSKPKSLIRVAAHGNELYVAIERIKLNKKHFEESKPHKRPFFYPGSMNPKLARCMVNLSRVKEGQLLLDPFCGTGGILIEAGLIGCRVVGSDIYWKMKNGTSINLDYYGITDYRTFNLDVRELKMYEKVSAVVTDPPYGISTSTGDIEGEDIFKEFFKAIYDNMDDDAYLCMASPHYVDLKPIADKVGFDIVEQYGIKMHRSLTRIITVICKKLD